VTVRARHFGACRRAPRGFRRDSRCWPGRRSALCVKASIVSMTSRAGAEVALGRREVACPNTHWMSVSGTPGRGHPVGSGVPQVMKRPVRPRAASMRADLPAAESLHDHGQRAGACGTPPPGNHQAVASSPPRRPGRSRHDPFGQAGHQQLESGGPLVGRQLHLAALGSGLGDGQLGQASQAAHWPGRPHDLLGQAQLVGATSRNRPGPAEYSPSVDVEDRAGAGVGWERARSGAAGQKKRPCPAPTASGARQRSWPRPPGRSAQGGTDRAGADRAGADRRERQAGADRRERTGRSCAARR